MSILWMYSCGFNVQMPIFYVVNFTDKTALCRIFHEWLFSFGDHQLPIFCSFNGLIYIWL